VTPQVGGNAAEAGSSLEDHARPRAVARLPELADGEAEARHDRAEHARMAEEVAREKEGIPLPRRRARSLGTVQHDHPRTGSKLPTLYNNNRTRTPLGGRFAAAAASGELSRRRASRRSPVGRAPPRAARAARPGSRWRPPWCCRPRRKASSAASRPRRAG